MSSYHFWSNGYTNVIDIDIYGGDGVINGDNPDGGVLPAYFLLNYVIYMSTEAGFQMKI